MMNSSLRVLLLLVLAVAGVVPGSFAQRATGRSQTGAISVSLTDSVAATVFLKNRQVSFDLDFSEPSGNNFLEPKETGRLRVVLTNSGKVTVRGVVVRVVPLAPPSGVSFNDSIVVGDIPVSATRYAIFYFASTENLAAGPMTFQVEVNDQQGAVSDPRLFTFVARDRKTTN